MIKAVAPLFNRAVLFDTTQNSWHGLPKPITCPTENNHKSLAVYYLTDVPENTEKRGKALFVPYGKQKENKDILGLIKKRSSVDLAAEVYHAGNLQSTPKHEK